MQYSPVKIVLIVVGTILLYAFLFPVNSMNRCYYHLTGEKIQGKLIDNGNQDKCLLYLSKKAKHHGYQPVVFHDKTSPWLAKQVRDHQKMMIVVYSRNSENADPAFAVPVAVEQQDDNSVLVRCFSHWVVYAGSGDLADCEGEISYRFHNFDTIDGIMLCPKNPDR